MENRNYKFRAWDKNKKKIIHNPIINDIDTATNYIGLNDLFEKYRERGFEIVQFTGLLDKLGKEIYEGDILEIEHESIERKYKTLHFVEWVKDEAVYGLFVPKHERCCELPTYGEYIVIGNIYENSTLLTKPND